MPDNVTKDVTVLWLATESRLKSVHKVLAGLAYFFITSLILNGFSPFLHWSTDNQEWVLNLIEFFEKNEKLKWKNEEENFHLLHFHFSYEKNYITVFLDLFASRIYNFFSHGTPTVENMKGYLGPNMLIFGQKTANFDELRLTKPLIVATVVVLCQNKLYIRDEDRLRNTVM